MKRIALLISLLLSGCIVQSFYPYYTTKSVTKPTDVLGSWDPAKESDKGPRPWTITTKSGNEFSFVTYDKDVPGELRVVFFKVDDRVFADFTADDIAEGKINGYWKLHTRSVHSVCRVSLTNDVLSLTPLATGWLTEMVKTKKITLPFMGTPDDDLLFTASPEDWERFLARYGSDTNAFPTTEAVVLKRHKGNLP